MIRARGTITQFMTNLDTNSALTQNQPNDEIIILVLTLRGSDKFHNDLYDLNYGCSFIIGL